MELKTILKGSKTLLIVLMLIFLTFCWTYRLSSIPGLHGDEAWVGLNAINILKTGTASLRGMNNYTGNLESLACAVIFKAFGPGVFQLRIIGVVFNVIGIIIILSTLRTLQNKLMFLLLVSQSLLLLTSPRIAWEVNTFSLFFVSIYLASLKMIFTKGANQKPSILFMFFIINILGAYNHIIFASLPVATLAGTFAWIKINRRERYNFQLKVLFINMANIFTVFLIMRYLPNELPMIVTLVILTILIILLIFECRHPSLKFIPPITINVPPCFIAISMTLGVTAFVYFHGIAFFEVLGNYKILMHIFSGRFGLIGFLIMSVNAVGLIVFFAASLIRDLKRQVSHSLFAFVLTSYLGILPLFTTHNSYRYYLILYLILAIYLSCDIKPFSKQNMMPIFLLVIAVFTVGFTLFRIYFDQHRKSVAQEFTIGNGQQETSAHFQSLDPLLSYLKKNKIAKVEALTDKYFIITPILFYKKISPWQEREHTKVLIEYNYYKHDLGFTVVKKND